MYFSSLFTIYFVQPSILTRYINTWPNHFLSLYFPVKYMRTCKIKFVYVSSVSLFYCQINPQAQWEILRGRGNVLPSLHVERLISALYF